METRLFFPFARDCCRRLENKKKIAMFSASSNLQSSYLCKYLSRTIRFYVKIKGNSGANKSGMFRKAHFPTKLNYFSSLKREKKYYICSVSRVRFYREFSANIRIRVCQSRSSMKKKKNSFLHFAERLIIRVISPSHVTFSCWVTSARMFSARNCTVNGAIIDYWRWSALFERARDNKQVPESADVSA